MSQELRLVKSHYSVRKKVRLQDFTSFLIPDLRGGEVILHSSDVASAPQSAQSEQHFQERIFHHYRVSGCVLTVWAHQFTPVQPHCGKTPALRRAANAAVKKQIQTLTELVRA